MRAQNREDIVTEFHEVMGQAVSAKWTDNLLSLRMKLLEEEIEEIKEAVQNCYWDNVFDGIVSSKARAHLLKEIADLQYVLSGMAVALGLPLQEAFIRVHKSNMTKLGDDGKPVYREDGKVIKGPNYIPPNIDSLIKG